MKTLIKCVTLITVICFCNYTFGQIHNENYSSESMYLHTDKSTYMSGEIGWFKIYNTETSTNLPSSISKVAYVEVIDDNNMPVLQEKIALQDGKGDGYLNFPANLPSGVYIIRAYTNWMKNETAKIFFEKRISLYNTKIRKEVKDIRFRENQNIILNQPSSLQLGVAINKTYTTRDEMNITINVQDLAGKPTAANLSMSIYQLDELQNVDSLSIQDYTGQTSNNLLKSIKFLPEYAGHLITGTILNSNTQKPISEAFLYCSVPGTTTQFKTSLSDRNGNFKFEMPNLYNEGQIIVQADNEFSQISKIIIDDPFLKRSTPNNILMGDSINKALLLDRHINLEVQDYYSNAKLHNLRTYNFDTSSFYFKADRTYLLDNFVRFSTLEEVIREYVTPISLTKKKGLFVMNVYDEEQKQFFENRPLVLLNGVPIFNVNNLMDYDPLKIKKIDVVMRTYYYGNMSFNGIINFITYNGRIEDETLIASNSFFDYSGLQKQRDFHSPIYATAEQKESSVPDFRSTIQWTPNIDINSSGLKTIKTFSADLPGKYILSIQGNNKEGKAGTVLVPFEVVQ